MPRLDLHDLPDDPAERLVALAVVEAEVRAEFERAYAETYFDARLTGQIDAAIELRRHSRKVILRMVRGVNYSRGTSVRWSDGLG